MDSPEKLNYDAPLLLTSVNIVEDDKLPEIVVKGKLTLEWCNIACIEEYSMEYDDLYDWKEYKGTKRCWIRFCGITDIVLADFNELYKYWEYYLKNIRNVTKYQVPHNKLRKDE